MVLQIYAEIKIHIIQVLGFFIWDYRFMCDTVTFGISQFHVHQLINIDIAFPMSCPIKHVVD